MGVAGGVLLGNAIGSMFAGPAEAEESDLGTDDMGFEDEGGDWG
ncbi:hypothetical protein MASR1M32_20040 [Rhodobacter sp.]